MGSRWAANATSEREAVLVCVDAAESEAETVKLLVSLALGVPEICPVAELRLSPAGRLLDAMDQMYGAVPPVACW